MEKFYKFLNNLAESPSVFIYVAFLLVLVILSIGQLLPKGSNDVQIEAIKAGLHQDSQGHWVK